jgi:hypothetical protein
MKLVKLAVMVSVALFAALVVSNNGALASLSSRTVVTGSAYTSGVFYPINAIDPATGTYVDGKYRGPMTSLTMNYRDGVGSIILENEKATFATSFTSSNVYLSNLYGDGDRCFQAKNLTGTCIYPDGTQVAATGLISVTDDVSLSYSYWDFSYNTTTSTASALTKTFSNVIVVYGSITGADGSKPFGAAGNANCYAFFNESSNTGMNAATLATYGGVLVVDGVRSK